mmetsp:Transcript_110905/g.300987  ORF Transcript_110905/g.300987 Transcript_110905/m.300987 type:complete len:141 (+) Transcript_110905:370-792(+)
MGRRGGRKRKRKRERERARARERERERALGGHNKAVTNERGRPWRAAHRAGAPYRAVCEPRASRMGGSVPAARIAADRSTFPILGWGAAEPLGAGELCAVVRIDAEGEGLPPAAPRVESSTLEPALLMRNAEPSSRGCTV